MTRNRKRPGADRWGDIKGGMAFIVPVQLTRHESYRLMSQWAHKLVADLSTQFSGYNNGYLCAAWTLMKLRGWKSRTTLTKACAELEHYGIVERTQQGGRNRPNLYAFTWRRIDRSDGRSLDVAATLKPSNAWDAVIEPFRYSPKPRLPCPRNGLATQRQAQQVDSMCPSNGLRNDDKPSGWASDMPKNTLPCPASGHLIITTSTGSTSAVDHMPRAEVGKRQRIANAGQR